MRQITEIVVGAFMRGESAKVSNTRTNGIKLWLHGKLIAQNIDGSIHITTGDHNTRTTRERLNGIDGVHVRIKGGNLYLNDVEWNGYWVNIDTLQQITDEPEFDVTSEWCNDSYIKPIYSVMHEHNFKKAKQTIAKLSGMVISCRIIETDTAGVYRPNYFVVVMPKDYERVLKLLKL